jgi:hypothetical protein
LRDKDLHFHNEPNNTLGDLFLPQGCSLTADVLEHRDRRTISHTMLRRDSPSFRRILAVSELPGGVMKLRALLFVLLFALVAMAADEKRMLRVGETEVVQPTADRPVSFYLSLEREDYIEAIAVQKGVDVVVELYGPDAKLLLMVDTPTGTEGQERLLWVVQSAGEYRLQIKALQSSKQVTIGQCTLTLEAKRPASAGDRVRTAAQREAVQLWLEGGQQNDAQRLERALSLIRTSGDRFTEGRILLRIGINQP